MSYSVQTTPISRWKGYEDEDEEGGEGTKMKMEEDDMEDDEMARLHTDEEMPDVFNDLMQTPSISLSLRAGTAPVLVPVRVRVRVHDKYMRL